MFFFLLHENIFFEGDGSKGWKPDSFSGRDDGPGDEINGRDDGPAYTDTL